MLVFGRVAARDDLQMPESGRTIDPLLHEHLEIVDTGVKPVSEDTIPFGSTTFEFFWDVFPRRHEAQGSRGEDQVDIRYRMRLGEVQLLDFRLWGSLLCRLLRGWLLRLGCFGQEFFLHVGKRFRR